MLELWLPKFLGASMSVENKGVNLGVIAHTINGPVTVNNSMNRIPSLVTKLVEALAGLLVSEVDGKYRISSQDLETYGISSKIDYNSVIKYKRIIEEHAVYHPLCDAALNIVDDSNTRAKAKILKNILEIYKRYRDELLLTKTNESVRDIDIIRENADLIIEHVTEVLQERIIAGYCNETFVAEDIHEGLPIIVCYAFIECKILEKPEVEK